MTLTDEQKHERGKLLTELCNESIKKHGYNKGFMLFMDNLDEIINDSVSLRIINALCASEPIQKFNVKELNNEL